MTAKYITVREAANRLGLSRQAIYDRIYNGYLKAILVRDQLMIPADALKEGKIEKHPRRLEQRAYSAKTLFSIPEAAIKIGFPRGAIFRLALEGAIPVVRDPSGKIFIRAQDLPLLREQAEARAMSRYLRPPEGFLSVSQFAARVGRSKAWVYDLIRKGVLKADRSKGLFLIPENEVDRVSPLIAEGRGRKIPPPLGYLTIQEAAERIGIGHLYLRFAIRLGLLKAERQIVGKRRQRHILPEEEVERLADRYRNRTDQHEPISEGSVSAMQAAKQLKIPYPYFNRLIALGFIRAARSGKRLYVPPDEIWRLRRILENAYGAERAG